MNLRMNHLQLFLLWAVLPEILRTDPCSLFPLSSYAIAVSSLVGSPQMCTFLKLSAFHKKKNRGIDGLICNYIGKCIYL